MVKCKKINVAPRTNVCYNIPGGGAHNVIVKGYEYYSDLIIVDPAEGCGQITTYNYEDLRYQAGSLGYSIAEMKAPIKRSNKYLK